MNDKTTASPYLNLYLGPELKARWEAYCAARKLKPGAALRRAIEKQIGTSEATAPPAETASREPASPEKKARYEISLTPSERRAIEARVDGRFRSMRDWIAAAIRGALTKEAQFGERELEALARSNYQLQAIGRNLNQIARRLNEGREAELTAAQARRLEQQIAEHTRHVSDVMRACSERWPLA